MTDTSDGLTAYIVFVEVTGPDGILHIHRHNVRAADQLAAFDSVAESLRLAPGFGPARIYGCRAEVMTADFYLEPVPTPPEWRLARGRYVA